MSDLSASTSGSGLDAAPAPSKPASRWEDFIDIFYAPSSVYERRRNSGFGIPMVVATLLVGVIFIANSGAMQPIMDAEFARGAAQAMKQNPQITPEAMEKMRSVGETFAKVGAFVIVPIAMFLTGLVLWIVGKFFDAKQTLAAAIMVAAFAYMPRVLESIVNGVQLLLMDPASLDGRYRISLGVGRFLDPATASPMLLALFGRLDLFTIWVTVLLAIGLSVTGRIPRSKAAIAAVIVWLVGALPGVLQAARM
ncbi:MAG TPA: YIP1 family protein [Gemmatimonadaceae bacterium]|nr:YIP1 family protein [Gemmatimonadaceae bacterium]